MRAKPKIERLRLDIDTLPDKPSSSRDMFSKLEGELKRVSDNPLNRPTPKTTGGKPVPLFTSPAAKQVAAGVKAKADKYCSSDGGPPTREQVDEAINEAAKLDKIAYDMERPALIAGLGLRAPVLDEVVAERREEAKVVPFLAPDEPWETAVNGHDLLHEIYDTIRRHVFMSKYSAMACSLWALFAYTHDAFQFSPRLFIHSPEMRCGKTTLVKVLSALCPKALVLVDITPATIYRLTDKYHPTLLFDEGDALDKDTLARMRGIMNAGHDRESATVPRCEGEGTKEVKLFSMWAPKVTARIGTEGVHPTEIDRSIMIAMRRMMKDEKEGIQKLPKRIRAALVDIRRRATRWAIDNMAELTEADPHLPEALNDRAQNNWEQLLAIADLCGEGDLARKVALKISGEEGDDMKTLGALLLSDLRDIFDEEGGREDDKTQLPTSFIVMKLLDREDRPWKTLYRGQPIKEQGVAKYLKPYRITPKRLKLSTRDLRRFQSAFRSASVIVTLGERPQGYRVKQFKYAWNRYLSPATPQTDPTGPTR